MVRRRTAPAPAVRRHYDTSEPARWRTAATPAVHHPTTPQHRLKVFSQATTGGPLRRHGVGSRFPLKMEPGADGCDSGKMTVAFSLAWLKPSLELLQTGVSLHRKAWGPCASTKMEPANDRPSPRSVLVQTSTRPSAATGRQASFSTSRAAIGLASVGSWQRQGYSHSKPKNLSPCYLSVGQFLCWEEPCKLPR